MSRYWREFEQHVAVILAMGLIFFAVFTDNASAQINAGRRLALVVGNTSYQNVAPLKNAVRDADAVSEALIKLGFEVLLLKDAKANEIEAAVEQIREQADDAEATLFYYSGHGFQMKGANFLVPVDAVMRDRAKIEQETLRLDAIIASLQKKGRQTLVFLDACRNDPLPVSVRGQTSGQGLAQVQTGKGTFVAFATQPGNVTADGAGDRSPFTNAFVEHVETPGISISDMMIRIRNTVEENTLQRQTPWDQSSLRSQFYFNPAEEEKEELSEETLELLASLDPALRKKFAERFGIKLPDEEGIDVPVESARPRLSIAPVKVKVNVESKPDTETETAELEPEPQKPTAPRLALSPALGGKVATRRTEENGGDLGVSGTVEVAQPRFRPSPAAAEPDLIKPAEVEPEQQIAVLLPSDRRSVRSPAVSSSPILAPRQTESFGRANRAQPGSNDRVLNTKPNISDRVKSNVPADIKPTLVPSTIDRAAPDGDTIASLRPVGRGAPIQSARTLSQSLPGVDPPESSVRPLDGQSVLQPVVSLATRIVGEDVTPKPTKQEQEPVQLASLDPQDVKPKDTPPAASVPGNLPLAIQQELYRLGCYRNSRDGVWGNKSAKALLRYYLQKKESPDLIDPEPQLYAKLSAEETVICKRTEPAKPRRKVKPSKRKKPAVKTARARPKSAKPVKRRKGASKPTTKRRAKSSGKKTARKATGGGRRIKKIKKLGGAFR